MLEISESMSDPCAITQGKRRLEKEAVDVNCSRELSTVFSVGVHGDVGILVDPSSKELTITEAGSAYEGRRSKHTHGVTKAEDSAILDVQVDVCVGHFDAANDLADIDVCNAGSMVSVRVGTNDVCTTSAEVVVLAQEAACDGIGVLGGVDSCSTDVDGLEAGVGEVRPESKGLSSGGCAGGERRRD